MRAAVAVRFSMSVDTTPVEFARAVQALPGPNFPPHASPTILYAKIHMPSASSFFP